MTTTTKKTISLLLVLVQLFVLFPVLQPQAEAAQSSSETPVLNKTIVGTVKFQSFNFLGDNKTGDDGVDYHSTFYYTDDYFSHSAINDAVNTQSVPWSQLDDASLAACSMDFAVASYTTNAGNIVRKGGKSYANTNYTGKYINAKNFLETCGFEDFESVNYEVAPTADSIAYCIAHKEIYIWDEATQQNKTFQLVAVGVRGAGYGAEWANNVTIGTPGNGANVVRHEGFDDSAQKVCAGVDAYIKKYGIAQDVKYWVSGFSRAAAVANLAAGYLTDNKSVFHAEQRDIYAYTYECPQAASTSENALAYKNIHNILNAMDAVPKVSPSSFNHQRLGVDYVMPYYGNTSAADNTAYYNLMRGVLQTIAVGTTIDGTYEEDPLIAATDPSNYPYNRPVTIYKMSATKLVTDAIGGSLMTEFGTEVAKKDTGLFSGGNVERVLGDEDNNGTADWYMDKLIDELIKVFLTSTAFDRGYSNSTTNVITHRTRFIDTYQDSLRTLFAYFLDFSGPAFLGLVDQLMEQIIGQLKLSNAGFALAFVNFYNDPTGSYGRYNLLVSSSWRGKPHKDVLISEAKSVAVDVADDLTEGYNHPTITRAQMHTAMEKAVGLVIDLYADELDRYESQYFGTFLRQLNVILSTHEQETVLSWIMAVDPNHMNRSCRTITVPASADVTLYEFREQYGETPTDGETTAQPVAVIHGGGFVNGTLKDERITLTQSGSNLVIRYPASLEIRADVTPTEQISLGAVQVNDYQTLKAHTKVSDSRENQYEPAPSSLTSLFTKKNSVGVSGATASDSNTRLYNYGALAAGDTLHILVNGMSSFESADTRYELSVDKTPNVTVLNYVKGGAGGTNQTSAFDLSVSTSDSVSTDNSRVIKTRQRTITVPASSVYFDDELTGNSASGYSGATTRLDWNDETEESVGKLFWYKFRGTRIDVYCTTDSTTGYVTAEIYENNNGEAGERVEIKAIKSSSGTTRYNVPTVSFDGLDANKDYFLRLYALKGSNYRLDGIRVYHSADETDSAVKTAYEAAGEQNAKYVNLRALLLGSVTEENVESATADGALFYTDSGESYALTSDDYQTNSPKNEIYLKTGEKVAFQIVGEYEKVAVGLSAPESKTNGGSVTVTDSSGTKTMQVAPALDQYYTIRPAADGKVVIENTGAAMIAVTNVKLSGDYTAPAIPESVGPLMVSRSLMRYAADFSALPEAPEITPEPTPEITPEPTPEPTADLSALVQELISSFVQSLFGSISRLFGH